MELRLKTLYLIRHGQTEWNAQQRMQGRLDSPLTAAGRAQADANGKVLQEFAAVDELVVSPSGRTRHTADIVNAHLRAPVSFDDALMERDCGDWSGLTLDEIASNFPEAWQARENDPYHHRPPGGENFEDMVVRVRDFLDSLFERNLGEIALVTHGALSRAILSYLMALEPVELATVRHPNDLIYRLNFRSSRIEASHFQGGAGPRAGLLQHSGNETILRFNEANDRQDR
jgi:probable phosphoglycerate mutase